MVKTPTEKPLNPKQELFCQLYSNQLFGNATLSYSAAYGIRLDNLSHEAKHDKKGKFIEESPYQKKYDMCSVCGSQLLRNPKITTRYRQLLRERMKPEEVDSEHAKIIFQDEDVGAKLGGIREYNRVNGRVMEKVDITSGGEPIQGIEIVAPVAR